MNQDGPSLCDAGGDVSTRAGTPAPTWVWLGMIGIVVIGFSLRVHNLLAQSLWEDEAASVNYAAMPLSVLLGTNVDSGNPPGYRAVLKLWIALFGRSELVLRLFSLLCGTAAIGTLFALGRRLSGSAAVGLTAALLLAVSQHQVDYSQETRAYAWLVLLTICSTYSLLRALHGGHRCWWAAFALAALLAAYSHYSGLFVLIGQGLAGVLWCWRLPDAQRLLRRHLVTMAIVAVLLIPEYVLYLRPGLLTENGYVQWQCHVNFYEFAYMLLHWTGGMLYAPLLRLENGLMQTLVVVPGVVLPLYFVWRGWPADRRRLLWVGVLYGGLGSFVLLTIFRALWFVRYNIAFQPLYLIGLASGVLILARRSRLLAGGAVLATSAVFLPGVFHMWNTPWRPDYRAAVEWIETHDPEHTSRVCVYRFSHHAMEYYLPRVSEYRNDRDELLELATRRAGEADGVFVVMAETEMGTSWAGLAQRMKETLTLREQADFLRLHVLWLEASGE
ncbi:MAG: glycosyltransferase family 39 protein [Phycisphaerae bacterium]|nr:glycosyltransferase family 39 protein [Phycisphaerae bacterium]